mgnify:FL=1
MSNALTDTFNAGLGLLAKSVEELESAAGMRTQASKTLWQGAVMVIDNRDPQDKDRSTLAQNVIDAMGKHRKGDASKIKKVALAADRGLDIRDYPNLSKAYNAACAIIDPKVDKDAADVAAADSIAATIDPAKPELSPEDAAAALVLSKGMRTAAVLLLDALKEDAQAGRGLLVALTTEMAQRADYAKQKAAAEKVPGTPRKQEDKGGAAPATVAAPVAAPTKPTKPTKPKPAAEPAEPTIDLMFGDASPVKPKTEPKPKPKTVMVKKTAPVKTKVKVKAKPVKVVSGE